MNVLNSRLLVGLRFKDMRFLNKCSTLRLHFLFFSCVTNLSQNSLLDASTDEAENEFAKYQLGL